MLCSQVYGRNFQFQENACFLVTASLLFTNMEAFWQPVELALKTI